MYMGNSARMSRTSATLSARRPNSTDAPSAAVFATATPRVFSAEIFDAISSVSDTNFDSDSVLSVS